MSTPPLLSKPTQGEDLFLYLATFQETVNLVLVWMDSDGSQKPIYYASKVLHEAETRYF